MCWISSGAASALRARTAYALDRLPAPRLADGSPATDRLLWTRTAGRQLLARDPGTLRPRSRGRTRLVVPRPLRPHPLQHPCPLRLHGPITAAPKRSSDPVIGRKFYGVRVKVCELVAVPDFVLTVIRPVFAPLGTVAVISMSETTVNVAATELPKWTAVVWVRPVPLIVTKVPTAPLAGLNPLICGKTRNGILLLSEPWGAVTLIRPSVAPAGTVAVRYVGLRT